jgi:outer membrane receptor protein involved in Fe transport
MKLGLLAGSALACLSAPVAAQEAGDEAEGVLSAAAQQADGEGMIVVTGSRIQRSGLNAPTPITAINAEQLEQIAPTTLAEGLSQLPQFLNSDRPATTGISYSSNAGASYLNLRSLGASRTLVLLDGRRIVPATRAGTTDISLLPQALVEQVDVVTGGASAAYGSDAVTGVVNFVLNDKFDGVKGRIQGGISDRGDDENYRIELAGGFALGDRTHVVLAADYFSTEGVEDYTKREWFESWGRITNPDPNGPRELLVKNVNTRVLTHGGLITSGPLAGTQFLEGGVPAPFEPGSIVTSTQQVGGSGIDVGEYFQLSPKNNRGTLFAHVKHEFSSNLEGYAQFLYGRSRQDWHGTAAGEYPPIWALTIYRDNAFLPESIAQRMDEEGITSFQMGRMANPYAPGGDFPFNRFGMNSDLYSGTVGLDGKLGNWRWNAYYQYGRNDQLIDIYKNPRLDRVFQAVDAVLDPGTGRIVCSSTLVEGPNGCVPLNMFGAGSPSDEAIDWILGSAIQDQRITQHFTEAMIQGEPFSLWAGDVSIAVGGAYRKETLEQTTNAESLLAMPELPGQDVYPDIPSANYRGLPAAYAAPRVGVFERGNPRPISGGYDVWEVFGEVLVPLAKDLPFARNLDVNAAVRYADYQGSGGVTTWKGGINWEPAYGLRFRATRSRDIRAPNLGERFDLSRGNGSARDPELNNAQYNFVVETGGNPNASPERADTLTFGVVYQPEWLSGLGLSIDYYDIKLKDALGQLGVQTIVDNCFSGSQPACGQITRNAEGLIVEVDNTFINIAQARTKGLDFELSYSTPIPDGSVRFRALATYIDELSFTEPNVPTIDRAGQTGPCSDNCAPKWQGNANITVSQGPLTFFVQERFIGAGKYNTTYGPAEINDNTIDAAFYTDIRLGYDFGLGGGEFQLYASVTNLFDRDPSIAPSGLPFGTTHTNTNLFDVIGRRYTLGVSARY